MARGRGLEEVFHYFIPEDEQRAARRLTLPAPAPQSGNGVRPARLCVPVSPARLLSWSLAVDLAAALAQRGDEVRLIAPSPPPPLLPQAARVRWISCPELGGELGTDPLEALVGDRPALVAATATQLARLLRVAEANSLDGLLLPVEASPEGIARALGCLRVLDPGGVAVVAAIVGAGGDDDPDELGAWLRAAAQRQLDVDIELLAPIERDDDHYRALLHGRPVVELETGSPAAARLEQLGNHLRHWTPGGDVARLA